LAMLRWGRPQPRKEGAMDKEGKSAPVWLVRAGRGGEDEETALTEGLAIIGFRDVGDLRAYATLDDLTEALLATDPTGSQSRVTNLARQLWAFREGMKVGDIVVLPLKSQPGQIALGRVTGDYEFRQVGDRQRHVRRVKWERPDVLRSTFRQDLLYSFGAFMTVCRISRNDAECRVAAVLAGKPDPGPGPSIVNGVGEPVERADIAQAAHDEIVNFVRTRFAGHNLAILVAAALEAEGFRTTVSSPGPDGGVDILAGHGPLGLDAPLLCVQVKATQGQTDVNVFRALQGAMSSFSATQGLLVSWGGFTQAVRREARQHAFKVSLWDQTDLVQAIYRTYPRLSPEIQAELPLKRIWVLVHEEDTP